MQTTYLIANWKSNKTPKEAQIWTQEVKANLPPTLSPNITPVLCLPFIHLQSVKSQLPKFNYATQDLSPYPDGAYTGAVSARMLGDLVKYTLVGHSERRQYFHETPPQIARKVTQALEYNITPIVGVDKKNWHHQLNQFKQKKLKKIIIMYEPPEAIGSGTPAPLDEVTNQIKIIKQSAPHTPILYGGSIDSNNITPFLKEPLIAGVVPGGSSLDAKQWLQILKQSQQIRG